MVIDTAKKKMTMQYRNIVLSLYRPSLVRCEKKNLKEINYLWNNLWSHNTHTLVENWKSPPPPHRYPSSTHPGRIVAHGVSSLEAWTRLPRSQHELSNRALFIYSYFGASCPCKSLCVFEETRLGIMRIHSTSTSSAMNSTTAQRFPPAAAAPNTQGRFPEAHQGAESRSPGASATCPGTCFPSSSSGSCHSFLQPGGFEKGETVAGGMQNNAARGQARQHCGPVRACDILLFTLMLVLCSGQYDPFKFFVFFTFNSR